MQSCGPRDDIDLNCFGPATAEALVVEAAKSGNHSAFEEYGHDTRTQHSSWSIGSSVIAMMRKIHYRTHG
jgi:hypothetical protein